MRTGRSLTICLSLLPGGGGVGPQRNQKKKKKKFKKKIKKKIKKKKLGGGGTPPRPHPPVPYPPGTKYTPLGLSTPPPVDRHTPVKILPWPQLRRGR